MASSERQVPGAAGPLPGRTEPVGWQAWLESLARCDFSGANLSNSTFTNVDLRGAVFHGAMLSQARFLLCQLGGADFSDAQLSQAQFDRCSLVGANFRRADLRRASLVSCGLERACFDEADLTLGSLAWSNLDRASLRRTMLDRVESLGVNLIDADLTRARSFAYAREFVIEALRRGLPEELAAMQWLGAVAMLRTWCYPAWRQALCSSPGHLETALRILSNYPESGCCEALGGHG